VSYLSKTWNIQETEYECCASFYLSIQKRGDKSLGKVLLEKMAWAETIWLNPKGCPAVPPWNGGHDMTNFHNIHDCSPNPEPPAKADLKQILNLVYDRN